MANKGGWNNKSKNWNRFSSGNRNRRQVGGNQFARGNFQSFQTLPELYALNERDLILQLQSEVGGIEEISNDVANSSKDMAMFVRILTRLCSAQHYSNSVLQIFYQLTQTQFSKNLTNFVTSAPYRREDNFDWVQFFSDVEVIMAKIFQVLPNNFSDAFGPVIYMSIKGMVFLKAFPIYAKDMQLLIAKYEHFEDMRIQSLQGFHPQIQMPRHELLHAMLPPDNFRNLSITLNHDDVHKEFDIFLRPNLTCGKYNDTEHYLDVNFRLLREDFISPLRDGLQEYIQRAQSRSGPQQKFGRFNEVKFYHKVKVLNTSVSESQGIVHQLQFDYSTIGRIEWMKTKRLLFGSLVCLSADNFQNFVLALIVDRNPRELSFGRFIARFLDPNFQDANNVYDMAESPAYYEAYAPVLLGLKQLDENNLPFQAQIVRADSTVNPPNYLTIQTLYTYSFKVMEWVLITQKRLNWKPLEMSTWPSFQDFQLDESQYKALQTALTRQVALIQGPPGTGKTFIGLKVAEIILQNQVDLQILVVCYTNHALDQYLEGILKFCPNGIIRVGGQSKSMQMTKFNLAQMRRRSGENRIEYNNYKSNMILQLQKTFNKIAENKSWLEFYSAGHLIDEWYFLDLGFLSNDHWLQLGETMFVADYPFSHSIEVWLEVEGYYYGNVGSDKGYETAESVNSVSAGTSIPEVDIDVDDVLALEEMEKRIEDVDNYISLNDSRTEFLNEISDLYYGLDQDAFFESKNVYHQNYWKIVQRELKKSDCMSEEEAQMVDNLWDLNLSDRWRLYRLWDRKAKDHLKAEISELHNDCERFGNVWMEYTRDRDFNILSGAKVIGMTTTGAAKHRSILQRLQPQIVIVEEAAEVLEAHIVTALSAGCQHLILIGDQQQLRPNPTVYRLVKEFSLDVSLFERLINNGVPYEKLKLQHRMRPEIATLLVPHIYKDLQNHQSVDVFPNVLGMHKNVFFLDHKHQESTSYDSRSRSNAFEANMLIGLCWYLLSQGYQTHQITILATYLAQVSLLKRQLSSKGIVDVKCTAVDNFQGEECDIILLSLVRSNSAGSVGFLKVENRVCVALSRAKIGLYCVGNFELLTSNSDIWKPIVNKLIDAKMIGSKFKLVCQNHPQIVTEVSEPIGFLQLNPVNCTLSCNQTLKCGHQCSLQCHISITEHEDVPCQLKCSKVLCPLNHQCQMLCFHECEPCDIPIVKKCPCGHENRMLCSDDPNSFKCQNIEERKLKCGHYCNTPCFVLEDELEKYVSCSTLGKRKLPCGHNKMAPCNGKVENMRCGFWDFRLLPCGHKQKYYCHSKDEIAPCKVICEREFSCGHLHFMECGENERDFICEDLRQLVLSCGHNAIIKCCDDGKDYLCREKCVKKLNCGHKVTMFCSESEDKYECKEEIVYALPCKHQMKGPCYFPFKKICTEPCAKELKCGHKCKQRCGDVCEEFKCLGKVELISSCGHRSKVLCGEKGVESRCTAKCDYKLKCGHKCKSNCYECCTSRVHPKCKEPCKRMLLCGHRCYGKCGDPCFKCRSNCDRGDCVHKKCGKKCSWQCPPCKQQCAWKCEHLECQKLCYETCDREPCDLPCPIKLSCGHRCPCLCGEPCSKICPICKPKEFEKVRFVAKDVQDSELYYVLIENCGHLIERKTMDNWVGKVDMEAKRIEEINCPKCGFPIRVNFRYHNAIIAARYDIAMVKTDIVKYNANLGKCLRNDLQKIRKKDTNQFPSKVGKHISQLLRRRNVDNFELIFFKNKSNFIEAVNRIKKQQERMKISRPTIAGEQFKKLETQIISIEALLETLDKKFTASETVWTDLSWELKRVEYSGKILFRYNEVSGSVLSNKEEIMKQIESLWNMLKDCNSPFDNAKEIKIRDFFASNCAIQNFVDGRPYVEVAEVEVLSVPGFVRKRWFKCKNDHVFYVNSEDGNCDLIGRCCRCVENYP